MQINHYNASLSLYHSARLITDRSTHFSIKRMYTNDVTHPDSSADGSDNRCDSLSCCCVRNDPLRPPPVSAARSTCHVGPMRQSAADQRIGARCRTPRLPRKPKQCQPVGAAASLATQSGPFVAGPERPRFLQAPGERLRPPPVTSPVTPPPGET